MQKTKLKFKFVEASPYERARKRSEGAWYCNGCRKPADTEHKKEECHRCSDWNGCGHDCTLSNVICKACGWEETV